MDDNEIEKVYPEAVISKLDGKYTVDDGYSSFTCVSIDHANAVKQALDEFAVKMREIHKRFLTH